MDSSLEFAAAVRTFAETLGLLVWASFERGLKYDEEWPEEHFFHTLVDEGLRGGHPQAKSLLGRMSGGGRYSLFFETVRHNPQRMEPLTGADLAFLVELQVDGRTVRRRVMLVQLKKAERSNGTIAFQGLHRRGGKRWFGRDLHQAERMLLFTQCAVYWLAVVPNPATDQSFLDGYVSRTNFAERSRQRRQQQVAASATALPGVWPFLGFAPHRRYFLEFFDEWLRHFWPGPAPSPADVERWYDFLLKEERDRALRTLWSDLAAESERLHGMRSRVPVLVAHAESVLPLRPSRDELSHVYPLSVSLPEFILDEVLRDGFGDDNEQLIEALMRPRPGDYVREVVRQYAEEQRIPGLDEADAVRAVVRVQLSVRTPWLREE